MAEGSNRTLGDEEEERDSFESNASNDPLGLTKSGVINPSRLDERNGDGGDVAESSSELLLMSVMMQLEPATPLQPLSLFIAA